MTGNAIPILKSVTELPGKAVWLCDIWGVMHNGLTAFDHAVKACQTFRSIGGQVVLISNSPRPSNAVVTQLEELGVDASAYDVIVTSGDVTRALVAERLSQTMFHLGPERDKGFFEGLNVRFAQAEEADVLVCTGLIDDETEQPEDYMPMLRMFAERGVPMICANPDLKVERGSQVIPCAGALAALYEGLGQTVIQAGKPYAPIYVQARALVGSDVEAKTILAIGDGIDTDIRGASNAGLDALYIASRVHLSDEASEAALTSKTVETLFRDRPFKPVAAMSVLKW